MANDTDMAGDPGRKTVGDAEAPLTDEELTTKDRAYAPGSERETEVKQNDQSTHAQGVDTDDVDLLPGTGGPDDYGIVEPDPGEIHMPRSDAPGSRPV
ncbi:hypothetical protein ACFFGH_11520 [Lysobacter korlensis]|uniref:Uncharacterized protein n=1 Tax=Lysobacter korlensis TaxID=553636 RepID=A0ABV6RNA2_9GAMM